MDWAIYGALIAGSLAVLLAAGLLAVRALQAWRTFKRARRHLAHELERLAGLAEETSRAAERAGDQAKLEASLGRLRIGLAQFAVIRSAVDEVTDAAGRVTGVMPRK